MWSRAVSADIAVRDTFLCYMTIVLTFRASYGFAFVLLDLEAVFVECDAVLDTDIGYVRVVE